MQGSPDLTDAHAAFYLHGCLLCVVVARSHLTEGRATQAQCIYPNSGFASPELTQAHNPPSIVN
jgi:hypothetical protein